MAGRACAVHHHMVVATLLEPGQAERTLRGLKTKVLDIAGNAQRITCNGEVVAQRQPHGRGGVALVLKG